MYVTVKKIIKAFEGLVSWKLRVTVFRKGYSNGINLITVDVTEVFCM